MMRLSKTEVSAIKNLYKHGVNISTIANSFDVDPTTIEYHVNPNTKKSKQGRYIRTLANSVKDKDIVDVVGRYIDSIRG